MNLKRLAFFLIFVLIFSFSLNYSSVTKAESANSSPTVFLGVDVSFESIPVTEQLIDNVSSYTNVFVIGCYGNYNLTRLTILSQYAFDKGLSFIVYTDNPRYPSREWLTNATSLWGSKFLGIYDSDEPGGKQLDQSSYPAVTNASSYADAASQYVNTMQMWLHGNFAFPTQYKMFTSDYALYWYDYQGGYDTVFAEFSMNYSQQLNLDLIRGAATAFNKDWGVMITWKYTQPPYMESGPELYSDMVLAYENGAKYIIIFDGNANWTQNVLDQGQLDAINQFWQYAQANPRTVSPVSERTAYVLPEDYAYGFRGPQDKIWGLWEPDSLTNLICCNASKLIQQYGKNLDIVYPDGQQTVKSLGYRNVFYWNDPQLADSPTPSVTNSSGGQTGHPSLPISSLLAMELFVVTAGIISFVAAVTLFIKSRNTRSKLKK